MLSALQLIYDRLYRSNPRNALIDLEAIHIHIWLQEQITKSNSDSDIKAFKLLNEEIKSLAKSIIPIAFLERFCLAQITNKILEKYPVNVAEAYILSLLTLESKGMDVLTLNFKLGMSGLLTPTLINNQKIEDAEAIAKFIISSLQDAKLIQISNKWVKLTTALDLNV